MDQTTILLVDDDPEAVRKLVQRLDDENATFLQTSKTSEALSMLKGHNVDLVVVDAACCPLPIQEFVPIIRSVIQDLPIIVTTDHNTADLEKQIRAQKIFYYHIKGFGDSDLELAVKNALEKQRSKYARTYKEGP